MGPADAISGLNVFQKQSSQESVAEGEVAAWDPGSRVGVTAVSPNSAASTARCQRSSLGHCRPREGRLPAELGSGAALLGAGIRDMSQHTEDLLSFSAFKLKVKIIF